MLLLFQGTLGRSVAPTAIRLRTMSSFRELSTRTSHVERTVTEPRDESLHRVILSRVDQINDRIRLLRLDIPNDRPHIKFLPGQWLDVHVPGIPKPGGFTITSTPALACPGSELTFEVGKTYDSRRYLELAVQESPQNPSAAWLWRPVPKILGQELQVRVGGSFVWPPPNINLAQVKKIVVVAGGVGINPLMSIIIHLSESTHHQQYEVSFLYSVREPEMHDDLSSILFLARLVALFSDGKIKGDMILHLTPREDRSHNQPDEMVEMGGRKFKCRRRRIRGEDLLYEMGEASQRQSTVCYICGVPAMTDELVLVAQEAEGMDLQNVMFERWW